MKLSAAESERFLRQPSSPGALIYGLDGGMVRQRVQALTQAYLGASPDPLALMELSADQLQEDPALLADELAAFSLMAPKRVILLRDAEDRSLDAIEQGLRARNASNFLIAYAVDSLAGSKLRSFAERSPEFAAIACYKDEGAGLENFIRQTLKAYGLQSDTEVTRFLADRLSGDRQIIVNELEKLSLYVGNETEIITMDDVYAVIHENNDRSFDDLAFAVASGDVATLCRLSDRLLDEGNVGLLLVRAVMRHFQKLQQLAMREAGQSVDAAIEALRPPVFFKLKPVLKAHALRWSATACDQALAQLQILELDSKRFADQHHARLGHGLMAVAALAGNGKRRAA